MAEDKVKTDEELIEPEILSLDSKDLLMEHLKDLKPKKEEAIPEFESYSFDLKSDEKNKKAMIFFFKDDEAIKEITSVVKGTEEAKKEINNKLLRFAAEFENFKKRVSQEKSQAASYVKDSIFRDLLNFIDNFERGLSLYEEKEKNSDFFKGMKAVFKECDNFLFKNNIKRIEVSLGDEFNPSIHEAIEVKKSDKFPKDKVIGIVQSGYNSNDKLLRPAMVVVSSGSDD
jgi:molecular chaperone GrpE